MFKSNKHQHQNEQLETKYAKNGVFFSSTKELRLLSIYFHILQHHIIIGDVSTQPPRPGWYFRPLESPSHLSFRLIRDGILPQGQGKTFPNSWEDVHPQSLTAKAPEKWMVGRQTLPFLGGQILRKLAVKISSCSRRNHDLGFTFRYQHMVLS